VSKFFKVLIFCILAENCFALPGFGGYDATMLLIQSARSRAMGSVGYALSDDETSLFFNPAGLGLFNSRLDGGIISYTNTLNEFYS